LATRLASRVGAPLETREPGGSPGAEALRSLLVTGTADRWSAIAETLILFAARDDHLTRRIRPALAAGQWVLCDRFSDSTRAYQGAAGGTDPALIAALEAEVIGATRPDLTLLLDLPVDVGLARATARGGEETRFEGKGPAFHQRLRAGFLAIAAAEPERVCVINAAQSPDEVEHAVWAAVSDRLGAGW
jgi:dTMP kinase